MDHTEPKGGEIPCITVDDVLEAIRGVHTLCPADYNKGEFGCTRAIKHIGPHIAAGSEAVYAVWND